MATSVRFIIDIPFGTKEQKTKIISLYGKRFYELIREVKNKKYFSLDYVYLPKIRDLVKRFKTLDTLIPSLKENNIPETSLLKILEVGPMFNLAPLDLKAYILLGLGLRVVE